MYRMNLLVLLFFISIPSIFTEMNVNSSRTTTTTLAMWTSEEISLPCTYCQTMTCRCSSIEPILNCSSYLLNLTFAPNCAETMLWKTVDFSSRNLPSFDVTQLLSLRMSRLLLKSNSITNIHENTFDSIGNHLLELDLQMNQLANISSKWLNSKLTQLKILNLASNQLESFEQLDHVYLPYLQELNLSCNQIEIFPRQIHQWTSLTKLDLSFNKLSSLPRFALIGLDSLRWLSLASNRNLSCIVQDSFKQVKTLQYLDLSSTNLVDLDGCIFIQLMNLRTLKIERLSINCSSCWLPIAKKNSIELVGQCLSNNTIQRLDSLTNQQLHSACLKSSLDCSFDSCEPGSFDLRSKSFSSARISMSAKNTNASKNRTIEIILGIIFSIIAILTLIIIVILIYRWKQGKKLLPCCDFLPTASSIRRQRHKQINENNPTVIESVVTHGANMNMPPYSHHDYVHSNETTSNNKRKLYNPMFTDTPPSDAHFQSSTMVLSEGRFHKSQLYSDNL